MEQLRSPSVPAAALHPEIRADLAAAWAVAEGTAECLEAPLQTRGREIPTGDPARMVETVRMVPTEFQAEVASPDSQGRWWDDKGVARTLGLSKDQQKKMDGVFAANRSQLLESYNVLQREESNLEALNKEKKPDEAKIFASIDAVAQARAALAKANAHMLLQVRQEMDAEQNARMQKLREQSGED